MIVKCLNKQDMKRLILISGLFLLALTVGNGQSAVYQPGEKLSYTVHYGPVTGGEAKLELIPDTFAGKEVWHTKLVGKTTGMADAVFKVLDTYECYLEPSTGLPLKSIRNIKEGRYRKYNIVLFDHYTRQDSAILNSDLTGIHIAQKGIHDILTAFYWFRSHNLPDIYNLKKGETITIMTWFTDELFPLRLKYVGTEDVKTKLGKIKCYKFNPVTETGRLFKTEEDVTFWFSTDKNYLPVKIRFDIFVGAFIVDIVSYEGLLYDLKTINKNQNN